MKHEIIHEFVLRLDAEEVEKFAKIMEYFMEDDEKGCSQDEYDFADSLLALTQEFLEQ